MMDFNHQRQDVTDTFEDVEWDIKRLMSKNEDMKTCKTGNISASKIVLRGKLYNSLLRHISNIKEDLLDLDWVPKELRQ